MKSAISALPKYMVVLKSAAISEPLSSDNILMAICGIDDMYFTIYIAALSAVSIAPAKFSNLSNLPTPPDFISRVEGRHSQSFLQSETWQRFQQDVLCAKLTKKITSVWQGDASINPLLDMFFLRMAESVDLLWSTGMAPRTMVQVKPQTKLKKQKKRSKSASGGVTEDICPDRKILMW